MAKCAPFDITVSGNLDALFAKVKAQADEAGVVFEGSADSGRFAGKGIEGIYRTSGSTVTVEIAKKPLVYPCSVIEKRIRAFFEGA